MSGDQGFIVKIDDEVISVPAARITGLQLRLLGKIPPQYEIIVEGNAGNFDRVLLDTDVLDLHQEGLHLFSKPPTAFG
jgi:hypothetical protein